MYYNIRYECKLVDGNKFIINTGVCTLSILLITKDRWNIGWKTGKIQANQHSRSYITVP